MPVTCGKDKDGCYCRWGTQKKYRYECGDSEAKKRAERKAAEQGKAVRAQQNKGK